MQELVLTFAITFIVLCVRCWRFVRDFESDSQVGWTALMDAAAYGHADCVRLLIDAGADKEAKSDVRVAAFLSLI